MNWANPLPLMLIPTIWEDSYKRYTADVTGLPLDQHPGAFGVRRKHDVHTGIDLYCPEGTPVRAVEDGTVVAVIPFTGAIVDPPMPWWHDTHAVMVEGESGVVLYGEVTPGVEVGQTVVRGEEVARVKQVLKKDKGRPMSMLHLELHKTGSRTWVEWLDERPDILLDPSRHLKKICGEHG